MLTDDDNNSVTDTEDDFDHTYYTISSQSSVSSQPDLTTKSHLHLHLPIVNKVEGVDVVKNNYKFFHSTQLLDDTYNNATNILDCIEDMIIDENSYLLAELKQIIHDIEISIPNNTFIIPNNLQFTKIDNCIIYSIQFLVSLQIFFHHYYFYYYYYSYFDIILLLLLLLQGTTLYQYLHGFKPGSFKIYTYIYIHIYLILNYK